MNTAEILLVLEAFGVAFKSPTGEILARITPRYGTKASLMATAGGANELAVATDTKEILLMSGTAGTATVLGGGGHVEISYATASRLLTNATNPAIPGSGTPTNHASELQMVVVDYATAVPDKTTGVNLGSRPAKVGKSGSPLRHLTVLGTGAHEEQSMQGDNVVVLGARLALPVVGNGPSGPEATAGNYTVVGTGDGHIGGFGNGIYFPLHDLGGHSMIFLERQTTDATPGRLRHKGDTGETAIPWVPTRAAHKSYSGMPYSFMYPDSTKFMYTCRVTVMGNKAGTPDCVRFERRFDAFEGALVGPWQTVGTDFKAASLSGCNVTFDLSTVQDYEGEMNFTVTGLAGTTINWRALVEITRFHIQ